MTWYEWLMLPAVGAAGGFLAGMLGVGGGLIFIPLLTWLFTKQGLPGPEIVRFTLANSIFLVVASGISGTLRQHLAGTWQWRKSLSIGIPGTLASLFFTWLIQQGNWYDKHRFQTVFLGFLMISIGNMLFGKKVKDEAQEGRSNIPLETMVGLLAGMVVSFSGLGGGVIMVPLFRMLLHLPMRKATALSLSIIPVLGLGPVLGYLFPDSAPALNMAHTGYLVWPYALPMALGVVLFAPVGLKTARRMPERVLRLIFAGVSAITFVQITYDIFIEYFLKVK